MAYVKDRNRTARIRNVARALQMNFVGDELFDVQELLTDFKLFDKGRNKKIYNVLHKADDWLELDLRIFDYEYTQNYGKHKKTYRQTVFFMRSRKLGMPEMLMKPETFFNKITEYLNITQDIDFEEYPKFSSQYLLQGEDEEYIRTVMTDKVLKFFTKEKGWTLETLNFFMVLYKHNRVLKPWEINRLYGKGMKLHEMFKMEDLI